MQPVNLPNIRPPTNAAISINSTSTHPQTLHQHFGMKREPPSPGSAATRHSKKSGRTNKMWVSWYVCVCVLVYLHRIAETFLIWWFCFATFGRFGISLRKHRRQQVFLVGLPPAPRRIFASCGSHHPTSRYCHSDVLSIVSFTAFRQTFSILLGYW